MKKRFLLIILCSFIFYDECKGNSDAVEEATVALELLEMDLDDHCSNLSIADRNILLKKQNAYKNKYEVMKKFGIFSKKESEHLRSTHSSGLNLQSNYNYRWKILEKMGDNELNSEDWEMLSKFVVEAEQITEELQIPCKNIPCDKLPCTQNGSDACFYSRSDVNDMLKKSRDANYLRTVWSEAQKYFTAKGKNYKQILPLVKKAAEANDFPSPEEYWSQMVEYPDVFLKTKSLWEEIEPLYKKIHDFVRLRLEHIYQIPSNESLPVYLLGSEFGLDWTEIADKILPHRYLYDEINASLHHEVISGKKAYRLAERVTMNLGMKRIQPKFWEYSLFNMTCPSRLLVFCGDKYSQVITCNKTGYKEFLDAHEDLTRVSLTTIDFSTSIYNKFRYSVVDEAIAQLSTILAVKNMPLNGIIPEKVIMASETTHHNQMTALLLAALRILPKLPYYFLVDEWRLQELNNPSEDPVKTWWEFREKYQLVKGVTNQEYDFLADSYIRNNKPYVGKFLGTILQFKILEHFQHNSENHINILTRIAKDKSFKNLIKQRISEDWFEILQNEFDIYDVDASALLDYFKPLEEYIENAPLTQVTQTLISRTTTPIPTTTTMKTTSVSPEPEEQVKVTKNTSFIESRISNKETKKVETKTNTVLDKEEEAPSSNYATKAAWIGALIGVLSLLVIIGIIGNKKFRKKPRTNNRRFN